MQANDLLDGALLHVRVAMRGRGSPGDMAEIHGMPADDISRWEAAQVESEIVGRVWIAGEGISAIQEVCKSDPVYTAYSSKAMVPADPIDRRAGYRTEAAFWVDEYWQFLLVPRRRTRSSYGDAARLCRAAQADSSGARSVFNGWGGTEPRRQGAQS